MKLKGWIVLAAAVIIVRVILEEAGALPGVHNVLGVTWLLLLVPIYLGVTAAGAGGASPIKSAAVAAATFAVAVRFMLMITYSMAWIFGFSASRFRVDAGGVVGEPSALWGAFLTPLITFVISALVAGLICAGLAAATAWVAGRLRGAPPAVHAGSPTP